MVQHHHPPPVLLLKHVGRTDPAGAQREVMTERVEKGADAGGWWHI